MKKFDYNNTTFIRYVCSPTAEICHNGLSTVKSSDWEWLPLPFNQTTAIADELKKRGGYAWQCRNSGLH